MPLNKPPKIFLYGYYGLGNVGDDLLLQSVVERLLTYAPDAQFVIRSLQSVSIIAPSGCYELCNLDSLLSDTSNPKAVRLFCYAKKIWLNLKSCDFLIFGGGTLFHDVSRGNLLLLALLVCLARLRGARVLALGVGVAKIHKGLQSLLMRFILRFSDDFCVRDKASESNCRVLGNFQNLRRTADLVLSLPSSTYEKNHARHLAFTLAASDLQHMGKLVGFSEALRGALSSLVNDGWRVTFVSFQELNWPGNQLSDTQNCMQILGESPGFKLDYMVASSTLPDLAGELAKFDVVLGMRFHSIVVAALLGIPFAGLGRDQKLSDFCQEFGMPFLTLSDIDQDKILGAVQIAAHSTVNKNILKKQQSLSNENFKRLAGCLS